MSDASPNLSANPAPRPEPRQSQSVWSRVLGLFRRRSPVVAVVRVSGAIGAVSPLRAGVTLAGLAPALEAAFETPRVKAVALLINSPGGSAVQSHLIFQRVRALAAENEVPVIAFVEDVAASGGYMIACAADEIIADPSSIVGSIGVISAGFGFVDLIHKLGVERRIYAAGENKATLDPFQPERADDVARLKAMQQDVHAHFIALVKERRGPRLKGEAPDLFTGAFWAGGAAQALGLVDRLGDLRSVMRARFGDKVKFRVIDKPRGFNLSRLWPQRGAGTMIDPAAALATLEERALWSRYGL